MELPLENLDINVISDPKYDILFKHPSPDLYDSLDITTLAFWVSANNRYSFVKKYFDSRAASYFKSKNYDFDLPMCPGRIFLGRWYNEKKYYIKRAKYLDSATTEIPEDKIRPKFPLEGKFRAYPAHLILLSLETDMIIVKMGSNHTPYAMCLSPDRTYLILHPVTVEGDYYKIDRGMNQLTQPINSLRLMNPVKPSPKPKYYVARVEFDGTTTMVEINGDTAISDCFIDTSARYATIRSKPNFIFTQEQLKTFRQ